MTKLNASADHKQTDNAPCNLDSKRNVQSYNHNFTNEHTYTKRPTRQAIHRHIDLIQRKRRKHLNLLKRVLIQEEFENSFVKLNNSAELSDSDSDNDSMDELFYRRKFARQRRTSNMIRFYVRAS